MPTYMLLVLEHTASTLALLANQCTKKVCYKAPTQVSTNLHESLKMMMLYGVLCSQSTTLEQPVRPVHLKLLSTPYIYITFGRILIC